MNRARGLLAVGAVMGLVLAGLTLVRGRGDPLPATRAAGDAVAWVDGEPIERETFARFVGAAARSRGALDLDAAERRALLERLIDEELLLREGLALGLARHEPGIRRAIVSAVIDGATSAAADREPGRPELEALYAETHEQWLRPGPVQAEAAWVPVAPGRGAAAEADARGRAFEIAARARSGESLRALNEELGESLDPPLPAAPVPIPALRRSLPAAATEALLGLEPGAVADPVRSPEGWWVVRLVSRAPAAAAPLDSLLSELRAEWIQRQHDARLREHLALLRRRAEIRVAGDQDP